MFFLTNILNYGITKIFYNLISLFVIQMYKYSIMRGSAEVLFFFCVFLHVGGTA